MATPQPIRKKIAELREAYIALKSGKESLLAMIDNAEKPESVYNSNAIENSTLTLKETEKILLGMEFSRNVSVREVFKAKNLARVIDYTRGKTKAEPLTSELILSRKFLGFRLWLWSRCSCVVPFPSRCHHEQWLLMITPI